MTVLMFGWEFPPHISGGLGTACFGLTKSLIEQNTRVLFVVPRAYGDEEVGLISASDFLTRSKVKGEQGSPAASVEYPGEKSLQISIASSLSPYNHITGWPQTHPLVRWNHEFSSVEARAQVMTQEGEPKLTGAYGPSLLDEVQRYGQVASTIACKYNFDVIHAHDWLTYPAGIMAKKISKKPLIVHVHATEFDRAPQQEIDKRIVEIERKGMEEADLIITVSRRTRDTVVSKYKINRTKIRVVYNGVEAKAAMKRLFVPKVRSHVVTFLGRVTYQKGPRYFVEAAAKVLKKFPDAHFVMAGAGDLLPTMMDLVARLNLSSAFHFTGFIKGDDVRKLWSVSSVYVMPSVSEPFGITPLEAMQAGVPVIVSRQSGAAEVMTHAIKVDFWNTAALANAIVRVLKCKRLSDTLKVNGRTDLRRLTWKRAAKHITTLYNELRDHKPAVGLYGIPRRD